MTLRSFAFVSPGALVNVSMGMAEPQHPIGSTSTRLSVVLEYGF